jgi:hypothetical protein
VQLKLLHTTTIVGTGRSIADPIRPAVADVIKKTPKVIIWSRDLRECVIAMPEPDPADLAEIEKHVQMGRARWLTDTEADQWMRGRLGMSLRSVAQSIAQSRFFRHARGARRAPRAQGDGAEGGG